MNVNTRTKKALTNLTVASLLSEGEILFHQNKKELCVPFGREKSYYLLNYLNNYNLGQDIIVEPQKGQFKIKLNDELNSLANQWYKSGRKIFNIQLGITHVTYKSVIVCINLFGMRKVEGIGIPTTTNKEHLRTLCYCLERILGLSVLIGNNQLRILDIPELFIESMDNLSTIDSSEMANYLTKKEKSKLQKAMSGKGDWQHEKG